MSGLSGRRSIRRLVLGVVAVAAITLLLPAVASAHPLGNFTINHFAGLRIAPDRVLLDVVIDQAEIPTFQERSRIDLNGDGTVSAAETEAERVAACPQLAVGLALTEGTMALALRPSAAGLSFLPGAGGAPTMRLVCEFTAALAAPLVDGTAIGFVDGTWSDRIGWREVIAEGDGTTIHSGPGTISASHRLTTYPVDLLAQPLAVRSATIVVAVGGPRLAPWSAPDATALTPSGPVAGTAGSAAPAVAAVPGGVAGEISGLFRATDLTPLALVLSLLTAVALGAGHALTPGHGKTIMAAYLVGTKGTARHALGLGLATAVSHTIGVLILALLIVAAGSALPADRVYPILAGISGVIVVAIGAWLLATQATRWWRAARGSALAPALASANAWRANPHSHADDDHDHAVAHRDGVTHDHPHAEPSASSGAATADGMHRHGWRVHSHMPDRAGGSPLTWRSLFALGLSGGLVPSTNALLILVATIAAGQAGYGVILVIAFGVGMAAVLVGVGLALVYASGLIARTPRAPAIGRALAFAPTVAAVAVLVLGLYLTASAVSGVTVL